MVGGGGGATPVRERRRGLSDEVQGGERNPFRGSIGAEEGRNGGSTELRRRPAMVAANVASLMVLGNGGWVVEGQRKVENVVGCLDCRMGRRREELGVQGGEVCYWRSPAGTRARGGALPFYSCSEGGRSWAHASWGRAAWCSSGRGAQ